MERRTDLETIRTKVQEIAAASAVARQVEGIGLVPALDGDGDEYIRVEVTLKSHTREITRQLIRLSQAIETAVDEIDGRFASVRFLDAA